MQERSKQPGTATGRVPLGATKPPRVATGAKPIVDKFPHSLAEWRTFAALPAVDRTAVYLRSIRAMVLFFTVLTVIGLTATIILMVIGINSAGNTSTVNTNPFG